jgi:hypothetical protein
MERNNQVQSRSSQSRTGGFEGEFHAAITPTGRRRPVLGRTAVWQARLALLVMINVAQLWILSATVEAALARHFDKLLPLIIASAVCWMIALTIFLWWKPVPKRPTSRRPAADK